MFFSLRDHLIICKCKRCEDPTELGSYMSALKCTKCDTPEPGEIYSNTAPQEGVAKCNAIKEKKGCILPKNPLDFNSAWSCTVHRQIEVCFLILKFIIFRYGIIFVCAFMLNMLIFLFHLYYRFVGRMLSKSNLIFK